MTAPLAGLKVIEFTHMVMGPTVGALLAGLGADVTRVEPIGGDPTRQLQGSGAGYFAMYNRDKASICLDLKLPDGVRIATELAARADILVENFRPGALERLGLGYAALSAANPKLIYCSQKGFLPGPYENRTALDEVAQMMGGLAYMTGPPGQPLRAGASVIDVTGGMFGVIAILAAVVQRAATGRGQFVQSALYETTVFLVGQHMAQYAATGTPAAPMPARVSAWAIYDVFATADSSPVFIGVVSDSQWQTFCTLFEFKGLWADTSLRRNNARVAARTQLMPLLRAQLAQFTGAELLARLEGSGLPYAAIRRPEDLFDDVHLAMSGGLEPVMLPGGTQTHLPILPIEMDGARVGPVRSGPTAQLAAPGADTAALLAELGYDAAAIARLRASGAVGR